MKNFEYAQPRTEAEVLEVLASAKGSTELLAGGTDLVGLLKKMVVTPDRVVDLGEVASHANDRTRSAGAVVGRSRRASGRFPGQLVDRSVSGGQTSDSGDRQCATASARHVGRRTAASATLLVFPRAVMACWPSRGGASCKATTAITPSWGIAGRPSSSARRVWLRR